MRTSTLFAILAAGVASVSAAAAPSAEAEAQFCPLLGEPCAYRKRAAEAFADALSAVTASNNVARLVSDGGATDKAARALSGLAGVVASTQANPRSFYEGLHLDARDPAALDKARRAAAAIVGTVEDFTLTATKRAASPEPEAAAQFCPLLGEPCAYRRSVANTRDSATAAVAARCYAPGGACANAVRDLHAMSNAARSVLEALPQ